MNKENFITQIKNFTSSSSSTNITDVFSGNIISIIETSEGGEGEIKLDISKKVQNQDCFFLKIEHLNIHTIGLRKNHCDGIVLYINLIEKEISVYLFELKTSVSLKVLFEKAYIQLYNAYLFIKYIDFENCFNTKYNMCIGYGNDIRIVNEMSDLKDLENYKQKLIESWGKNKIAIKSNFCHIKYFDFFQVKFNDTYIL